MTRKTLSLLAATAIISAAITACKKSSSSPASPRYRITTIIDSGDFRHTSSGTYTLVQTYQIAYNANNRISGMQVNNVEDYGGVISVYNNNSYFVYYLNSYAIHSTATLQPDSVVLNNLDEVLTVQGMHQAEFGYNDLFEVTNYFLEDILSGTFHSYNCTWNGGNMQQRTTDGSLDTATVSYYTDKPYTLGDGYELPLFLTYGNVIFHSKNLTRAITSQLTHINYSYTFDDAGRITTTQSFQTDSTVWSALVDTVIHSYTINYTAY